MKILVVDDEHILRTRLKSVLEQIRAAAQRRFHRRKRTKRHRVH